MNDFNIFKLNYYIRYKFVTRKHIDISNFSVVYIDESLPRGRPWFDPRRGGIFLTDRLESYLIPYNFSVK